MKSSDHFDGKKFFNPGIKVDKTFFDFIKWSLNRSRGKWPKWVENKAKPELPKFTSLQEVYVTFINHVTFLLQVGGVNILFDPVFCENASPSKYTGFKRVRRPGIELSDLPPIDIVMVSHNHYDHMDLESLEIIYKKFNPLFVVPLANKIYFKSFKGEVRIAELDWWQDCIYKGFKITLTPAQHWSARGLFDRRKALWGGFVVETPNKNKIYFMGDSGFSEKMFSAIQKKFGELDISFIPIGAYEPRWFMKQMHLNPDEAVDSHLILNSKLSIGMHYGTFNLSDEAWAQPLLDLDQALNKNKISNFFTLEEGQTKKFIF